MFSIVLSKDANRSLGKMPVNDRRRIVAKINIVAADPYAVNNNVTALTGVTGYRLRVGDYRVVYSLDDAMRIMLVEKIGARGSVYHG